MLTYVEEGNVPDACACPGGNMCMLQLKCDQTSELAWLHVHLQAVLHPTCPLPMSCVCASEARHFQVSMLFEPYAIQNLF